MYAAGPRSSTCHLLVEIGAAVYPRLRSALAVVLAALAAGCGGNGADSATPRPVTLALDFAPNAVHAGIYAAVRERLDRRHRLALQVRAPSASTDSLKLLASGRADLAIVDIHDLGLARQRGQDLVGVGALVQRPLAAVIARPGVERPRDLEGARVGVTGLPSDEAVLRSVLEEDGADPKRVRRVTVGFSAVPSLIARRVDAVVAFWNAEGVALRRRGVRTREFRVDDFGAPRYPELVLAAKRGTLKRRREIVEDVLGALVDGTKAALADPKAAIREIADISGSDEGLVRAELRVLTPALQPPLRLDRKALEGWASFDARFGILRGKPDVAKTFALDATP
jgi:putative hydroxymethylpyrimidine transport system substrate-binding protein